MRLRGSRPADHSQPGIQDPKQTPPEQVSFSVHASPSSHELSLFVFLQPVNGLQESLVQGLPSKQLWGEPEMHAPRAH